MSCYFHNGWHENHQTMPTVAGSVPASSDFAVCHCFQRPTDATPDLHLVRVCGGLGLGCEALMGDGVSGEREHPWRCCGRFRGLRLAWPRARSPSFRFWVLSFGFGGFGVWGFGVWVLGVGCWLLVVGCWLLGFGVRGLGFRVARGKKEAPFKAASLWFKAQG